MTIEQWIDQMYFCHDNLKAILKEELTKVQKSRKRSGRSFYTLQDPIKVCIEMEIMRMFNDHVGHWMESHVGSY